MVAGWAVVGYFVAEMLLKKSFRVFKAWKGAAAMTAVLLVLCLACLLDLFGVEGRVPDPSRVFQALNTRKDFFSSISATK